MLCRRYSVSTGVALIVIIAAVTLGLLAIVIAVLGATFHHREVSLVRVWKTSGHLPFTPRQATKYAIPGHPCKKGHEIVGRHGGAIQAKHHKLQSMLNMEFHVNQVPCYPC